MRHDCVNAGTALVVVCLALAGCNPTWTTQGKPNNNSMPLPPGARKVPEQESAGESKPGVSQSVRSESVHGVSRRALPIGIAGSRRATARFQAPTPNP